MRIVPQLMLVAALVGSVNGCRSDDPTATSTPGPAVVVDRSSVELDAIGAREQLRATVLDASGAPVRDAAFVWSSRDTAVAVVTDSGVVIARANGATAVIAAHDTLGASVEVTVRQEGTTLVKVSGDQQAGIAGQPLSQRLVARVTDRFGHPVEGATVFFRLLANGGGLSEAAPATDAAGLAWTVWTLGPVPGDQTVAASLSPGAVTPAIYNATAR